jgi:hypothetical protein
MLSATRPTGYPAWASGAAATNITAPTAQTLSEGFAVGEAPSSSEQNWWQSLAYGYIRYLDISQGYPFLGNASDGDLILGATNYHMSRHMQFGDLAIGLSGILDTNGWIPFVKGVFTGISGVIRCNGGAGGGAGNSGPGPFGGTLVSGPLVGGLGGGSGVASGGESVLAALGAAGGGGGNGASLSAGTAGSVVKPSGIYPQSPFDGRHAWSVRTGTGVFPTFTFLRGGGGGGVGGASTGVVGGGGGGQGGGVTYVVCAEANFVGVFQARGGDGAVGVTNAGGGGGGGGGGAAVGYARKIALTVRVDTTPGGGGIGGAGGSNGVAGTTGATAVAEFLLGGG